MKRGFRFQTKLMLAMSVTTAVAIVSLLAVTERKIKQSFLNRMSADFDRQVEQLRESRQEQTSDLRAIARDLAVHPFLVESLRGEPTLQSRTEFWRAMNVVVRERATEGAVQAGRSEMSERGGGPVRGGPWSSRFALMALMDLDGEIRPLVSPQAENGKNTFRRRSPGAGGPESRRRIARLAGEGDQVIAFFPVENREGEPALQEVIMTPVIDPDSGEALGLFLRATSSETAIERFLGRYQESFGGGEPLHSGIYCDGTLYARRTESELAGETARLLGERLAEGASDKGAFDFAFGGLPFRVHFDALDAHEAFPPAYQVVVFPLAGLREDLKDLRIRGSGIGAAALLAGLLVSAYFARRFAGPVRDLSEATKAIGEGRLDTRVPVRSNDELGQLAKSFNHMAEELKHKARYRELLGKVSDEAVAQAMVRGTLDLKLGGELKDVTVLFCDIRGFTELTESMSPSDVIDLVNEHMTSMTGVVRAHFGVVDKFVGDEIMAVFGALKSYGNDVLHAVECARDMLAERERLNRTAHRRIEIGIGISSGEVVAGCMGSTDRLNYTVLGARVNLGARLCGSAGPMEILIDGATRVASGTGIEAELVEGLSLKGITRDVEVWRVSPRRESSRDSSARVLG